MATVTVSITDVSLFHVAAAQLGDATQAYRIAALNSLTDFWLSGLAAPVTLTLPSVDASQQAGIPAT